ncbi:MAG: flagellar filament capping protein FliD [Chloroflexota bacterium]
MADLLSQNLSTTGTSSTNQLEALVESFRNTEQPKLDSLAVRKKALESKRLFFTNLANKIDNLYSSFDKFGSFNSSVYTKNDTIDSKFSARSVTSSKSEVMTATADGTATLTSTSVSVTRVATSDVLISDRKTLSTSFGLSGTYAFDLTIGTKTTNISVSLDAAETNETAMKKISDAINAATDVGMKSIVIKDTTSTAKMSWTATNSGGTNNIKFTDSPILNALGITTGALKPGLTNRKAATATGAGFGEADYNDLDALININGIDITRSSNTINDVITGVTLSLLKPQETGDAPVTLTTGVDIKAIKDMFTPITQAYNELQKYLNENKKLQRDDSSISSLVSRLRSTISGGSANAGTLRTLMDIGFKVGDDGTLMFSDDTKLKKALEERPTEVASLFTASDGFVSRINSAMYNLRGDKGLIDSRQNSITSQLDTNKTQTSRMQERIDSQANNLRKQYSSYLKTYYQAQGQYQWVMSTTV